MTIQQKIDETVKRLQNLDLYTQYADTFYTGHSGGKDSCLINALVSMAYGELDSDTNKWKCYVSVIHTVKPLETHPLTIKFLYDLSATQIIHYVPKEDHLSLGLKCQIDGTRIAEATRNDGRSTNFVTNGVEKSRTELTFFVPNSLFGLDFVYPIFDWSDDEVWAALEYLQVPISPEYTTERLKWNLADL